LIHGKPPTAFLIPAHGTSLLRLGSRAIPPIDASIGSEKASLTISSRRSFSKGVAATPFVQVRELKVEGEQDKNR
jgi:hypothetical protein